jgi:hypothetical protein
MASTCSMLAKYGPDSERDGTRIEDSDGASAVHKSFADWAKNYKNLCTKTQKFVRDIGEADVFFFPLSVTEMPPGLSR